MKVGETRRGRRREEKRRIRVHRRVRAILSAVVTTAVVVIGGTVGIQTSYAASGGVGWGTFGSTATAYKGFFVSDGVNVICAEAGKPTPTNALSNVGLQGTSWINANLSDAYGNHPNLSDNQVAGINRILQENQNTSDKNTAAAMEYAVRAVLYPMDADLNWSGGHSGSMNAAINYDLYSTAGPANVAAIQGIAANLVNVANSTTAGSGSTGSGTLTFDVNNNDNYLGTVTMVGTAGSTGSITLTNGVFTDTGSATKTDAVEGAAYPVRGVPPTSDGSPYKISGTGTFTAPGSSGYAANLTVFTSGSGQQASVGAGGNAVNTPFNVSGEDPQDRSVTFQPIVTTTATTFVQQGEKFQDALTFGTQADSTGTNNSWFQDSLGYVEVVANGVVYGPYDEQPTESATVPAGSPIAATASVTTGTAGPTVPYDVTTNETADESGFYTWVWTIRYADQVTYTRNFIPTGYSFTDRFGQVSESSIVPSQISATTQVEEPTVPLSGIAVDTATVGADGYWLKEGGDEIPVTFRWDAYYDTRAKADIAQVPASTIPAEASLIGTVYVTTDEPGTIATPDTAADGIRVPDVGEGSIVWVLSIRQADQPAQYQGWVEDWSDEYGVPAEISSIAQPTVATEALAAAQLGGTITDTAEVDGTLPAIGAELSFAAYQVPVTTEGEIDYPTGVTPGDLSWVCTDDNRIYENWDTPQVVTETGSYTSPEVDADEYAMVLWVERLGTNSAETGQPSQVIAEGECGIPTETSVIVDVTTQASSVDGSSPVTPGTAVTDTAILTGWVPENGTVTFDAYRSSGGAVCLEETRVFTETVDLEEGGRLYTADNPLKVTSAEYVPDIMGTETSLYFVETTRDDQGRIVSQGDCGEPDETLTLAASKLATTGFESTSITPLAAGAGALVLGGLAVYFASAYNRSRRNRDQA